MNAILKKLSDTIDVTESTPLYIQVANAIREKIMNGELKEGANLAPEYELADDLNVSLITTKKALDILVKEKLIYRRPRLGTFVGNIKNRILITDTHKILFLFCNARIPDQYSSLLFSGVEQACKENNFSLKLLKYMQGDKLLEKILKEKYTGILVSGLVYPEIILKLNKQQSPFVVIGYIGTQWKGEEELYQILPPAEEYGKIATDYLIKNNH
ncbi:MAG: GntR family transcriptional regulator, partial [Candidatus Omnitrophica bacterium]|nr:GntR family transcriptional regulator [Candidatus Omnitrophota bacterium]